MPTSLGAFTGSATPSATPSSCSTGSNIRRRGPPRSRSASARSPYWIAPPSELRPSTPALLAYSARPSDCLGVKANRWSRRRQIYEGKAKILYEGPEPGTLIQYFKDDATAFNAQKRGTISGKGVLNNRISEHIFTALADDRRPDPLHPPPQHARAADPPGRDHPDRGGRPQRRRRLAVQAPGDRGRHAAAAHDHRILLQGRCARRPDDRRRAYRLLRLGQPGRDERHRRHGDPGERLHVRHVRRDRHPPGRLQARVRPDLGRRLSPASSSPTRSAPTAAACGT